MGYHNLSNEEIVFLYNVAKSVVKQYEETFISNSLKQSLSTDVGIIEVRTSISDDIIETLSKSKHYTIMKDVMGKLEKIYDLIVDTDPELVEEINKIFDLKIEDTEE
jgi:hypothetical protein